MLPEIAYSLTSLNTTKELVKAALGMAKDAATRDAISELNREIYSLTESLLKAQIEYQSLVDIKKQLEQDLVERDNWDTDAPDYELLEVSFGVRVYSHKSQTQRIYERVWLCPTCFDGKQKRILQLQCIKVPREYICNHCKTILMVRPFDDKTAK